MELKNVERITPNWVGRKAKLGGGKTPNVLSKRQMYCQNGKNVLSKSQMCCPNAKCIVKTPNVLSKSLMYCQNVKFIAKTPNL